MKGPQKATFGDEGEAKTEAMAIHRQTNTSSGMQWCEPTMYVENIIEIDILIVDVQKTLTE